MRLQNISFKSFICLFGYNFLGLLINVFMVKEKIKPAAIKIKEYLESKGTKQIWLSEQTGISPEHISNILADRVLLTNENLQKINDALGTHFS